MCLFIVPKNVIAVILNENNFFLKFGKIAKKLAWEKEYPAIPSHLEKADYLTFSEVNLFQALSSLCAKKNWWSHSPLSKQL